MSKQLDINIIEYDTKYNKHFREVSDSKITTVEISGTGSGKTYFYRNSPNTIMLLPTNAMVREHNGLLSSREAKAGERSNWSELRTDKCEYMTYDKFAGHMKHEDLSNFNIIIDEVHIILQSDNDTHYNVLQTLLDREIEYKELKLISATIRPEVLNLYNSVYPLQVNQYVNTTFSPHVHFTKLIPPIEPTKKTLFFINSKDKMLQLEKYFQDKYPDMKILLIESQTGVPDTSELEEYDLILSTCVLKQGYSIKCHIDQVIIHNVYNSVGAMDIIQYMARPRINQPEIYVICASTHFSKSTVEPELAQLYHKVQIDANTDEEYQVNKSIELDKLLSATKSGRGKLNILMLTNKFENAMEYHELYNDSGAMETAIKQIIPSARVTIKDIEDGAKIPFKPINIKNTIEELKSSKDLKSLIEEIHKLLKTTRDERVAHKLNKLLSIEPIECFAIPDTKGNSERIFKVKDHIQVLQVLDKDILKRFEQHKKNIDTNTYQIRDKILARVKLSVGDIIPIGKIGRKMEPIISTFKTKKKPIDVLESMYSTIRYDDKGKQISSRSTKSLASVEITSQYTIDEDWYNEIADELTKILTHCI